MNSSCTGMEDGGMVHDIDVENISELDETSPRPLVSLRAFHALARLCFQVQYSPVALGESAEPKCVSPTRHVNLSPFLIKGSAKRRPIFASINLRSLLRLLHKQKYKLRLKRISRHRPAKDEPELAGVTRPETDSGRLYHDDLKFVNDRDAQHLSKSLCHIIASDGNCQIAEAKA